MAWAPTAAGKAAAAAPAARARAAAAAAAQSHVCCWRGLPASRNANPHSAPNMVPFLDALTPSSSLRKPVGDTGSSRRACTGVGLSRQLCSVAAALEKKPPTPPPFGLRPAVGEVCCRLAAVAAPAATAVVAAAAATFVAGLALATALAASFRRNPRSRLPSCRRAAPDGPCTAG